MVSKKVDDMLLIVLKMQKTIKEDIEDIKEAKHENLLNRNDLKQEFIDEIVKLKVSLNNELVEAVKKGIDISSFKEKIDNLEDELRNLYKLNTKLASIVLPIQQMYKEIVDDITDHTGRSILDIKV